MKAATYYLSVVFPGGGGGGGGGSLGGCQTQERRGRGGGSRTRLLPISLLRTARSTTTLSGGGKAFGRYSGFPFHSGLERRTAAAAATLRGENKVCTVHACWVRIKEEIHNVLKVIIDCRLTVWGAARRWHGSNASVCVSLFVPSTRAPSDNRLGLGQRRLLAHLVGGLGGGGASPQNLDSLLGRAKAIEWAAGSREMGGGSSACGGGGGQWAKTRRRQTHTTK